MSLADITWRIHEADKKLAASKCVLSMTLLRMEKKELLKKKRYIDNTIRKFYTG